MTLIPHGTASGYSYHGCRCDVCRAGKSLRYKERYARTSTRPKRVPLTPEERNRKAAERVKAWRKANPEKLKEQTARHRNKTRDKRRADSLARYRKQMEEQPEKVRARRRKFQTSEKGRAYQRVANYRRRSLPMSKEVRDWWLSLENPLCAYCSAALATEIDHVLPITRGGTNDRDNLVPACRSCNASKNNKTVDEWKGALSGSH